MGSGADPRPDSAEERLAELLVEYEEAVPRLELSSYRERAGDLFPQFVELTECVDILRLAVQDGGHEGGGTPRRIGPYRPIRKLGEGVSGTVYLAEDPEGGDPVAVKLIRESLLLHPKSMARFRCEIRAARSLDHPNIVAIRGDGEEGGRLYFAMDYIEGRSLADILDDVKETFLPRPCPEWLAVLDESDVPGPADQPASAAEAYSRRITGLFAPLAGALAHAAGAGLVHRDVKPANIMVGKDGRAILTDFGLAKIADEEMTSTQAVLGTPAFMSPEQAEGRSREVDGRSDLYSLGATLHYALTMEFPHPAKTITQLIAAILTRTPQPVTDLCPEYPKPLAKLVLRSLETDIVDRYQDGETLARDLAKVAEGGRPAVPRVKPTRQVRRFLSRRRMAIAGAVAVASLALLALFLVFGGPGPAEIDVEFFPAAILTLDEEELGSSPWSGEIDAGRHVLIASRPRFRSRTEEVDLERGEKLRLKFDLVPEDPFDREAGEELLRAHGVAGALPDAEPVRTRSFPPAPDRPWPEQVTILAPRGEVSPGAVAVAIHCSIPPGPLEAAVLAPDGERVLQVPLEGRAVEISDPVALGPGVDYTLLLTSTEEPGELRTSFTVAPEEALPEWLSAAGEPHERALAAALLAETRPSDALVLALLLAEEYPDRALPARLTLEGLMRLGLDDTPAYHDFLIRHDDASEEER